MYTNKDLLSKYYNKIKQYLKIHNSEYILDYSASYINMTFRKATVITNKKLKLGVQSIRKLNTSVMMQNTTDPKIVQQFNRHKFYDTTTRYSESYEVARTMRDIDIIHTDGKLSKTYLTESSL